MIKCTLDHDEKTFMCECWVSSFAFDRFLHVTYVIHQVGTLFNCFKFQAKVEYEKTLGSSASKGLKGVIPEGIKVAPRSPFKKELLANQLLKDKFALLRDQLTDFPGRFLE